MNYYILIYTTIDNFVEERQPYRAKHLALATRYVEQGHLVLGGALADPADEALLVFKADNPGIVRSFVEQDPYVINGLVTDWTVRKWNVVLGTAFDGLG